jgi:hypothetical protein
MLLLATLIMNIITQYVLLYRPNLMQIAYVNNVCVGERKSLQ